VSRPCLKKKMRKIWIVGLFLAILALDQIVKWWVINYQPSFVLTNNNFFGLVGNNSFSLLLSILAIVILLLTMVKEHQNFLLMAIIFAGALSNIADRIFRGGVVDYFQFFYWSINLADLAIILGICFYVYKIVTSGQRPAGN